MVKLDSLGLTAGNWLSNVKEIFYMLNVTEYFKPDISKFEIEKCLKQVNRKLTNDFEEKCMENINLQPVLRSYFLYKTTFKMEKYLNNVPDFKLRSVLSKLRLSSHELAIEKGRHTRQKTTGELFVCILSHRGN